MSFLHAPASNVGIGKTEHNKPYQNSRWIHGDKKFIRRQLANDLRGDEIMARTKRMEETGVAGGRRGGGEKEAGLCGRKHFPGWRAVSWHASLIGSCPLWVKERSLIRMMTLCPIFFFFLVPKFAFLSSRFLPGCLISLATHRRDIKVSSQSTCILSLISGYARSH